MRSLVLSFLVLALGAASAVADTVVLAPVSVTDWKAVYGRIETRDRVPARARIGGTLTALDVIEGDRVEAGQQLAQVFDEKLALQQTVIDAQLDAVRAQLVNAQSELERGENLLDRGVTTVQQLDSLRTQVDVLSGTIDRILAERRVLEQQVVEGAVFAPVSGRVLDVPVTVGGVIQPGETVVTIGGGGIFLRLAVPERHATDLHEGDPIVIERPGGTAEGRLEKVYPLIENGRVIADVEVPGLADTFVDARVLVRLPVGSRAALLIPEQAVITRGGLDFVAVATGDGEADLRLVVLGESVTHDGVAMVSVMSGLQPGDAIVTSHE